MTSNTETEIKFRVQSIAGLEECLRQLGFRQMHVRTREMNALYDFPSRSITRRGELLRLRQYGEAWLLTHKSKGKVGRHKSRIETETPVGDGNKLAVMFASLGLRPVF